MKVLQLCHKSPYPAKDGGCLAILNISEGLIHAGVDLKILTIETKKHPFEKKRIPKDFLEKTKIESVFVDTSLNIVDAFSSLITQDSYNISRFFSADFDYKLQQELIQNEYDVVHLESLFMAPYISTIRSHSNARIVLRSHNLEFIIWKRLAKQSGNVAKKTYLNLLARQLKNYELDVLNQVDGIAAISKRDANDFLKLGSKKPKLVIPFGINLEGYTPKKMEKLELNLFHLGSMDWTPNIEGLNWFLEDIWPKIHKAFPLIHFYLAGRDMPEEFYAKKIANVHIVGEVEDAKKFIQNNSIMIVPLLSGGGIRVKIIEGMALGKAIISTSVGAEGLNYKEKENIWIADKSKDFIDAINYFSEDLSRIEAMGTAARKLVEKDYDEKLISKKLIAFYEKLLSKPIFNPGKITA
jgi:glycosyltransferase involved in cell wall biosynthesis